MTPTDHAPEFPFDGVVADKDGRIVFGVYPGAVKIVYTSTTAGPTNTGATGSG